MFPANYVLAVALLTAPADSRLPTYDMPGVRPALQRVALAWEILDERETGYYLKRPEDFVVDLKCLRIRYQELADAPPVCDCLRWPTKTAMQEALSFNRAYRQHLDGRRQLDPEGRWDLCEAIAETDRLYQTWDTARDSRCEYYYVTVRRHALKRLREMIGADAYYAGVLPPIIPVWRLQRID